MAKIYSLGNLWKPQGVDFLVSKMTTTFAPARIYTQEQLRDVHPRLADAALIISDLATQFSTAQIVDYIKRLHCDFHFENTKGEMAALYDVTGIENGHIVTFQGYGYVYNDTLEELQNVDLLSKRSTPVSVIWVYREWLEKTYPGWETKFTTATELGVDASDALQAACSHTSLVHAVQPPSNLVP